MDQGLINRHKGMSAENIMKVKEIALVAPTTSKRKNDEEFEFTFTTTGFTDPEWRDIFKKHYGSEKARFHGSELTRTCKTTDLESEISRVKVLIMSTNEDYQKKREELIRIIEENKIAEKEAAINKNLEESEVQEMFSNFKV